MCYSWSTGAPSPRPIQPAHHPPFAVCYLVVFAYTGAHIYTRDLGHYSSAFMIPRNPCPVRSKRSQGRLCRPLASQQPPPHPSSTPRLPDQVNIHTHPWHPQSQPHAPSASTVTRSRSLTTEHCHSSPWRNANLSEDLPCPLQLHIILPLREGMQIFVKIFLISLECITFASPPSPLLSPPSHREHIESALYSNWLTDPDVSNNRSLRHTSAPIDISASQPSHSSQLSSFVACSDKSSIFPDISVFIACILYYAGSHSSAASPPSSPEISAPICSHALAGGCSRLVSNQ